MAELKNDEEEHALPSKRKPAEPNPSGQLSTDDTGKKPKLDSLNSNSAAAEEVKPAAYVNSDEEDEEEEYEGVDDADSDSDDDDEAEEDEEAVIDRKGKGIMKDDVKGKGKLIEESDDDDDDSSNVGSDSDGDSDLSDDPLAEVDLDNILPSRTRRRVVRPGLNISGKDNRDDSDA